MAELARTAQSAPHSEIRAIAALARQIPDAIHLALGDPDFTTPIHIIEAAAEAAMGGYTKYTPSEGALSLRELVAEKVRARNGIECTVEQVAITTGGSGGLFTTFLCLLDPGDEVLIPDPGWANYPTMVHVLGGAPVRYPLDRARDFEPDLEALERLVTPRTKVLLVNSPGNPTGCVYGPRTMGGLVDLASRRDLWLISDECYDEIVFEGESASAAALGGTERVITIFSFSKSYAMTGWRVGYVVAPLAVAPSICKAQEPVVANAASVSQKGAEAALTGPQECVTRMVDAYRTRRDAALAQLDARGVAYVRPRGAFYLMVDVSPGGASLPFARRLLEEEHVAVVPGIGFGPGGEGMVRVSFCSAPDDLGTALGRLADLLDRADPTR